MNPFLEYRLKDGTILQLYQGNRGPNPKLDFQLKQIEVGKTKHRAPSHTHWIVDLILKYQLNKRNTKKFIDFLLVIYEDSKPFKTLKERNKYKLKYTSVAIKKFPLLKGGKYSVEYITAIIELFSICEKQYVGAYMFKRSLSLMQRYVKDQSDFYTIISHSKRV